ncbi:MAG TPA: ROK family protein [Candidatus Saccharimonadales bacterium]|jgi:predicted NBD/HSP70 family sugar kinase|nr:ROK family protein [Candidatus Saccharimonadales bacterium]
MYLGIDIGGTKTLIASLDDNGVIQEENKFPTPRSYKTFIDSLENNVAKLSTHEFMACGAGVPGRLDRKKGVAIAFGNLTWHNVPIQKDIKSIAKCPVVIENDTKMAGLSEAMLLKDHYQKVLYVTISTGINSGLIVNQQIDSDLADSETGDMMLQHGDKLMKWESFASGKAIVEQFGKQAYEIHSVQIWRIIAANIAVGLIDLIAVMQPEVIVLGGGVGSYYSRYGRYLKASLKRYENAMMPIPPIREAARPERAVVYGCYDLAKARYGTINP